MTLTELIVELEANPFDRYGTLEMKLQTSYGRTLKRLLREGLAERRWRSKVLRRNILGRIFEQRTVEYQYRLTVKGRIRALEIRRQIQRYIEEWGPFAGPMPDEPPSYNSRDS